MLQAYNAGEHAVDTGRVPSQSLAYARAIERRATGQSNAVDIPDAYPRLQAALGTAGDLGAGLAQQAASALTGVNKVVSREPPSMQDVSGMTGMATLIPGIGPLASG